VYLRPASQFFIKGVMYSPSPIGSHPGWTWPHGDFFIPQYKNLWARDFPLLQALGANTLRIANWNNDLDHGYFLDQAHRAGLKVIVTFNMGNVGQSPVHEEWQMQQVRPLHVHAPPCPMANTTVRGVIWTIRPKHID
jgi:hypothetical protein